MREAFKLLDANNDGTIKEGELRQMLLTTGDVLSHKEVSVALLLWLLARWRVENGDNDSDDDDDDGGEIVDGDGDGENGDELMVGGL